MPAKKLFNAMTGAELRAILLKEIDHDLSADSRFQQPHGVTSLAMTWHLNVESYPNEPGQWALTISRTFQAPAASPIPLTSVKGLILAAIADNLSRDERFGIHLTYPRVTWQWTMPMQIGVGQGSMPRPEQTAPPQRQTGPNRFDLRDQAASPRPTLVAPPPALPQVPREPDPQIARLEAMIQDMQEQLRQRAPAAPEPEGGLHLLQTMRPDEVRHIDIPRHTVSGLDIEGGFQSLPSSDPSVIASQVGSAGNGSVLGNVPGGEMFERVEIGVTHPTLDDGGIGAPDAIRRQHGLPVPERQVGPSGTIIEQTGDGFSF